MNGNATLFDRIRDASPVISAIVRFQNSAVYPFLFAVLCAISGANGKEIYLPIIYLLTALSVFGGLFSSDLKVFLVPAFLIYYSIGMDVPPEHYRRWVFDYRPMFDMSSLPHFLFCLALIIATLVYRLTRPNVRQIIRKRGIFLSGILLIDAALLLNGAFSPDWHIANLGYALLTAIPLTLFYCLFLAVIGSSDGGITYACRTLTALGFSVAAQMTIIAYRFNLQDHLFFTLTNGKIPPMNRLVFANSWGLTTIIAAVATIAIPAAMYLARLRKLPILPYLSAAICFGVAVALTTRSAIIIGMLVFIICLIALCAGGKGKHFNRFVATLFFAGCIAAVCFLFSSKNEDVQAYLQTLLHIFRFNKHSNTDAFFSGRLEIWANGIKAFISAPILGSGFMRGCDVVADVYFRMYHNVILEFLGSMGIFGIFAFAVHIKQLIEVMLRRRSAETFILLLVPVSILGMSMADNFFFYPNFQLIYAAFLACAEISLERKRKEHLSDTKAVPSGKRPHVVFAYVEAGKGHVVPTKTVCNAFREKYGDRCDITESYFFTETGDKNLESSERLFTSAVRGHNLTPVMSMLCRLANLIAGDTFMLYFLFNYTVSGIRSKKPALKHLAELDADVIYSAHWSIPYHVNRMKKDRPYTVFFCPDIIPNGAFNVDCNSFLLSNDSGCNYAKSRRMFAGGNITRIPFPARKEISALRGTDKGELRRALGLEDIFTVSISDGGYGLARMEKTVDALIKAADTPMNVIALCGTNKALYAKLCKMKSKNPLVRLIPLEYTEEITLCLAASDLFVGKAGANAVAEPISLGVPVIITKCITYVERWIKNHYVKMGGALYIPNAEKAAREICSLAHSKRRLAILKKPLQSIPDSEFDAEKTADIIWEGVERMGFED
ncbi:MAG: O-antigen ligase family protein [Clostridia bacterium]|nr:O-antigen ligase family protein [Clostridia bacterium]